MCHAWKLVYLRDQFMVLFSPFTPHSNVRLTSHSNVRFFAPMGCHCYEDDTQVYMSFPLNNSTKSAEFLPTSRTYLFVYKQKKKKKVQCCMWSKWSMCLTWMWVNNCNKVVNKKKTICKHLQLNLGTELWLSCQPAISSTSIQYCMSNLIQSH